MNKKYSPIKEFLLCAFVIVMAIIVGIAGVYGYKGYKLYSDTIKEKPISEMYEKIKENEYFTSYDELPQIYIDAVTSAEDKRFMSHNGVDVLAMCRAAYNDIRTMSFIEGGSTITQQLAKNALFSQDKNFTRKFAEIFAAIAIEKEYNKEEIFEMYANYIYFGEGYYGIGEASNGYFEKNLQI